MKTVLASQYVAYARTDQDDRLIEADDLLVDLQIACGGKVGDTIAIPELLSLVIKVREFGLRLARQFEADDGENRIVAWAEISPVKSEGVEGEPGCEIAIASWNVEPLPPENDIEASRRRLEISRHLAEVTARLDEDQRILSVETSASDLSDFSRRAKTERGQLWTDLVTLQGTSHEQPLHWRLLDGAHCRIEGSKRDWIAHLEPLGQGRTGFVLYLNASTAQVDMKGNAEVAVDTPSLGRDLTPVLRQPINRIIANAETIRTKLAGPLAEEYSDYAADIANAGQHLLALIDDLSDLEVVEFGRFRHRARPDRTC